MMKNIVILLLLSNCISANAQTGNTKLPIDETTKLISFTGISEIAGVSKDSLYNKALAWCNTYYKNPTDVIREKNTEEGKIVCKARFMMKNQADKNGTVTDAGNVMYTMTLNFKDGKYRYTITDINWKQTSYFPIEKWMDTSSQSYKPEFDYYLQYTDEKAKEIIADLRKAMLAKSPSKKDDW